MDIGIGIGFRCRCGITVFAAEPVTEATPRLCTACQQDHDDPSGWVKRRSVAADGSACLVAQSAGYYGEYQGTALLFHLRSNGLIHLVRDCHLQHLKTNRKSVMKQNRDVVAEALAGRVIVDIGQLDHCERKALGAAVKAGTLAKWRGHWAPVSGASWGIGPLKNCYGTYTIAEYFSAA